MKTEMSLPGPALQEESQIWEEAVTVTVIGSVRRRSPLQWELEEEDVHPASGEASSRPGNLPGEKSCANTQAEGSMFSEASEIQTSTLGFGIRGHFFLIGRSGVTKDILDETEFEPHLGRMEAEKRWK